MTGYTSKRRIALDKLDDDDIQTYQQPWVGLTEDERLELYRQFECLESDDWEYEKAIEAKLKELNHG